VSDSSQSGSGSGSISARRPACASFGRGSGAAGPAAPPRAHLLLPGSLAAATGGTVYDRRIVEGLRALGWTVEVRPLDPGFPFPSAAALADADAALSAIGDGAAAVIDGLALGAMPELGAAHRHRLRLIALVHHPLALETGLDAGQAERLRDSETRALACARRVLVTSRFTAGLLPDFGVPMGRIDVIEPGTDPAPLSAGSGSDTPALLCVATVTPRKGHLALIEALAELGDRRWSLTCAGSLTRSPETTARLRRRIAELGLEGRVALLGELPTAALAALYAGADLFVLPSGLEGYGMAYAEALARGLPVLGTTAGAIPDTVPADAGLLVPPDDPAALRDALAALLDDAGLRARLAAGARRARAALPSWQDSAARFGAAVCRVLADG
jgi:glycosyltransferase involved in cell wall biosynthesis